MHKPDQKWEALLRTIEIRQRGNLLFATSEQEPTLFVSAYTPAELKAVLRYQLADIFRQIHGLTVDRVVIDQDTGHDEKHMDAFIHVPASSGASCHPA